MSSPAHRRGSLRPGDLVVARHSYWKGANHVTVYRDLKLTVLAKVPVGALAEVIAIHEFNGFLVMALVSGRLRWIDTVYLEKNRWATFKKVSR